MPEQTGAVQFVGGDESIERRMDGCPTPKKCSPSMNGPGQRTTPVSHISSLAFHLIVSVHTRLCALTHILPYAYHTYNYIIPMNMNPTCPSYSNNQYNYTIPMNRNPPNPQRPPYSHHPYKYTIPMNRNPPNLQRPPYSHHPYKYTVSNHRMNLSCMFISTFISTLRPSQLDSVQSVFLALPASCSACIRSCTQKRAPPSRCCACQS